MSFVIFALLFILPVIDSFQNPRNGVDRDDTKLQVLIDRVERLEEIISQHPRQIEAAKKDLMREIKSQRLAHANELSNLRNDFRLQTEQMKEEYEHRLTLAKDYFRSATLELRNTCRRNSDPNDQSDLSRHEGSVQNSNNDSTTKDTGDTGRQANNQIEKTETIIQNISAGKKDPGFVRTDRQESSKLIAFFATLSNHTTHLGANQDIVFDNVITNIGNAYDSFHGIFKAPVKGVYMFSATVTTYGRYSTHYGFVLNNRKLTTMWLNGQENLSDHNTNTIVLHLNQGDGVSIQNYDTDKTINGDDHSLFSGFLIAEDDPDFIVGK